MAKKGSKKSSTTKKKRMTAREREELLIENFVGIQSAMTNLAIKFEKLSENISNLLEVFETAAKDFVKESPEKSDKDMLNKINSLLEQNKTIAKGLVLMEEKLKHKNPPENNFRPRPLPSS